MNIPKNKVDRFAKLWLKKRRQKSSYGVRRKKLKNDSQYIHNVQIYKIKYFTGSRQGIDKHWKYKVR